MATIKPIEGRTIHQIQSGQVIVDLCSVVKELVENSLDAGAKSIDVRFKNQGLESIEVQDNGDGISPQNYETLALKHYTSKLSTYDDLATLQTFGFRGEALSSLCAVSRFSVTTCMASDAPKGTKLEFDVSGQLNKTSVVSAQKGTIVGVEDLFNNLPVRRQELERNIKREWNRVVGVLSQYACVQTGVKFMVSQQAGRGSKTTVISTKGNPSTRDNIVNVFGLKTVASLIPLELKLELNPASAPSQRWSTHNDGGTKSISITGWISRPASGEGRQTPDRQMFCVNSRPCQLPQISKAFNEVYKSYNSNQSPFIFANIELDTHMYDVNVSPDKRTILLHDQSRMLENLKTALIELFDIQDYTVPVSQLPAQKQPAFKQLTISRIAQDLSSLGNTRHHTTDTGIFTEDGTRSREASLSPEKPRMKVVTRASMNADRKSISLISQWTTRNADDRTSYGASTPRDPREPQGALSKEKQKLITELRKESEMSQNINANVEASSSQVAASLSCSSPVLDAVGSLAGSNQTCAVEEVDSGSDGSAPPSVPPNIPSIILPRSSSRSPSIFSHTRSQLTSRDVATIMIGDHTNPDSIRPPSLERPRRSDQSSPSSIRRQIEVSRTSSSFGNSINQRFAASTTTQRSMQNPDDEYRGDVLIENVEPESEAHKGHAPASERNTTIGPRNPPPKTFYENDDGEGGGTVSEEQRRAEDEAQIEVMIRHAEDTGVVTSQENAVRTKQFLNGVTRKKDATVLLRQTVSTSIERIAELSRAAPYLSVNHSRTANLGVNRESLDSEKAEERLSLTISKSDFANMRIIGQFNLGFILATRTSNSLKPSEDRQTPSDDLFIIDQHASDEKYNFERLQANTIVQSQRLVQPKTLDLTALEEEIVIENTPVLESNGFIVSVDQSGDAEIGRRCQLISLPLSRETTFGLKDLEELLALLSDHAPGSIPRPSKVRKMFAMRACRSSVMIGKTLTNKQLAKIVQHMGEIDKPWNCPHGRPTMRHLCRLSVWDDEGWVEGDLEQGVRRENMNCAAYVRAKQAA